MGGGGAEGHPLIAGYGSSSCLLFGEQGNGGNRPQRRGESSTPPTNLLPSPRCLPRFPPAEGGQNVGSFDRGLQSLGWVCRSSRVRVSGWCPPSINSKSEPIESH